MPSGSFSALAGPFSGSFSALAGPPRVPAGASSGGPDAPGLSWIVRLAPEVG